MSVLERNRSGQRVAAGDVRRGLAWRKRRERRGERDASAREGRVARMAHVAREATAQPAEVLPAAEVLGQLVARAGVMFNGGQPWDIQVLHPGFYARVLRQGSLGFGEAYMDGWWECEQLDECVNRLLRARVRQGLGARARLRLGWEVARNWVRNPQSRRRAFMVGERHYDVGNDLFAAMLDSRMNYSCGYWARATDLETAQVEKLELICRKLELRRGERLLDIGCGWGGLAAYAAEKYGVRVVGITVSREQARLARERCRGLPVEIVEADYRTLRGEFDKVVSVGMFEHVGPKNYARFFACVDELLRPDGLFLLHTIGAAHTNTHTDPWIDRYIFPNGRIPSARQLAEVLEGRFLIEDWHNFGTDYDRTLMAWWERFERAWPRLRGRYGPRFFRMWRYYLLSCAGHFRAREGQLWQLVLARERRWAGYRSVR